MSRLCVVATWCLVVSVCIAPIAIALLSPLLEWRAPVYIAAGLGGVVALSLLLIQPLLAAKLLPGLSPKVYRSTHRLIGFLITALVVLHVIGLWITSPPDVVDALLFVSATPFSIWGVIAMWSVFCTAFLVGVRRKLRARVWRTIHRLLACVTVVGTVTHAMMIEGTMGYISKLILCAFIVVATVWLVIKGVEFKKRV